MADDDRFYVKTLRMQNFRCFEDVELGPFDPHFNLLVGENGAGKSSVLVALADLFRWVGDFTRAEGPRRLIDANDMRYENYTSQNGIITQKVHPHLMLHARILSGDRESEVRDFVHDAGRVYPTDRPLDDTSYPVIVFYRTKRASENFVMPEEGNARSRRRRAMAFVRWDDAGVATDDLREWFKLETLSALQSRERETKNGYEHSDERVNLLNVVMSAVIDAIIDVRKIEYDADLEDIVIEDKNQIRHEFRHMSDGQRSFIGLVADIARRTCILNAPFFGRETLEKCSGLVLIDEIDLHLHPKWQRQIVPALKKVFPKIQFFATTHSPQVIGACEPQEIVVLGKDGQQQRPGPSGSYGRDSNWVLECIMGAEGRDPGVAKQIRSIWDAIEKGHFTKARGLIKKLRKDIGDDPDIIGAESYMWRIEHIGDEAAE